MPKKSEREVELIISGKDRSAQAVGAAVRRLEDLEKQAKRNARSFNRLKGAFKAAFSAAVVLQAGRAITRAGLQLERWQNALRAATGSAAQGAEALNFLRAQADRLGVELPSLVDGFVGLTAAAKGTRLEGRQTRDVFLSIVEAGTAMQLTSEQINGSLLAVSQIMSKGKVSAEELRGQLGERLPGAFQIAARAIGVTTSELDDMLKGGQLLSDDFLPKFAVELRKTFGEAAVRNADSAQAAFNRLNDAILNIEQTIASSVLTDFLADLAEGATNLIKAADKAAGTLGLSVVKTAEKSVAELRSLLFEVDQGLTPLARALSSDAQIKKLEQSRKSIVQAIARLESAASNANARAVQSDTEASDPSLRPPRRPKPRPDVTAAEARAIERQAQAERELAKNITPLNAAYARYFERIQAIDGLERKRLITTEEQASAQKNALATLEQALTVSETFQPIELIEPISFEQFKEGFEATTEGAKKTAEEIARLKAAGVAMGDSIALAFEDAIVQFKDFGSIARSLAQDLLRIFLRTNVTAPLANELGSVFKGLFGVGHTGGMVGALQGQRGVSPLAFAGARRYHAGGVLGLGPNEIPIIAERGEEILTRSDPRHRQNAGAGVSVVQHVTVDARGADEGVEARIRLAMSEAEERTVARIVREANKGGALSRAVGRRR